MWDLDNEPNWCSAKIVSIFTIQPENEGESVGNRKDRNAYLSILTPSMPIHGQLKNIGSPYPY